MVLIESKEPAPRIKFNLDLPPFEPKEDKRELPEAYILGGMVVVALIGLLYLFFKG